MKTELSPEDRERIEQWAKGIADKIGRPDDGNETRARIQGAEYENKYQREQQLKAGKSIDDVLQIYLPDDYYEEIRHKLVRLIQQKTEAERTELIKYNNNLEKTLQICLTVQPNTRSVDAMKAMVKTLLENSLKK